MLEKLKVTLACSGCEETIIIADIASLEPDLDLLEDYGLFRYGSDEDRKDDIPMWEPSFKPTRDLTHIWMKDGTVCSVLHPVKEIKQAIIEETASLHRGDGWKSRFLAKLVAVQEILAIAESRSNRSLPESEKVVSKIFSTNMVEGFGTKNARTEESADGWKTVKITIPEIIYALENGLPLDGSRPDAGKTKLADELPIGFGKYLRKSQYDA